MRPCRRVVFCGGGGGGRALAAAALALLRAAAAFSTPWPLPVSLTAQGGPGSVASVAADFAFSCDASTACAQAACASHPIVLAAFARYEARMRPQSPQSPQLSPSPPPNNRGGRDSGDPPPGVLTGVAVCLGSDDDTLGSATDESYSLVAPNDGAGALRAPSMFGMLRGLETLAQLLDAPGAAGAAPGARQISFAPIAVQDAPRFGYRGLLIDSARHFLPVETVLGVVDALALSKMNLLHWHLVDAQAFPCGSAALPELAAKGAYDPSAIYSPQDLAAVVAYAKSRGVRILPEFDVPGHGSWGAAHPEVMACPDVLDPTIDATYDLLGRFFTEMASIFVDDWFFLGGDEVKYKCFENNTAVAAWLVAHNMSASALQGYFLEQLQLRVLPALNKTVGVWESDGLQIALGSLPPDAFVNVYQNLNTTNKTVSSNRTTVVSLANDFWYLDKQGGGSYHQLDWWDVYDVEPTLPWWTPAQLAFLRGGETAMWGEGINKDNFGAFVWRATAAVAERLWSPFSNATASHSAAQARFAEHVCRLSMLGVPTGPLAPSWCPSDAWAPSRAADDATAAAAAEALALLDAETAAGGGPLSATTLALVRSALRRQLAAPR